MQLLKATNITKFYGKRLALNDISLELSEGEILGLLGPNGAGKSTFIKIITGLIDANSGEVEICGKNIKKERIAALSKIGAIIETVELYENMSAFENLLYLARLGGNSISKNDIEEAIAFVGMTNRSREKVGKYSLGMKQRIGIAQAIMGKPKLLILDEPTNGLDPSGIKSIRELFLKLKIEKGISVLISSHSLREIAQMCGKIAIINKGKLLSVKRMSEFGNVEPVRELEEFYTRLVMENGDVID